uniref:F-box domain-containing protein n=1 Tax=Rhizochromulina marina TaxID=1034831 RepID=A0A7S2WU79_9STRA|mmetsp:Transcript_5926/g.17310  ORF Transcript_5926/g.17310 Transcript_5926/m.17310 type:complete len:211 (+) Transcript_5926:67-699(+)
MSIGMPNGLTGSSGSGGSSSPGRRTCLLETLPGTVLSEALLEFLGARDMLVLEQVTSLARVKWSTEEFWSGLCGRLSYAQSGTRTRGQRSWREVYLLRGCMNCADPSTITMNSSCGVSLRRQAGPTNSMFSLCDACISPGCSLQGFRLRLGHDPLQLQLNLFRIASTRRTLLEATTSQRALKRRRRTRQNTGSGAGAPAPGTSTLPLEVG